MRSRSITLAAATATAMLASATAGAADLPGTITCIAQTSADCSIHQDGGRCEPTLVELPRFTIDTKAKTLWCSAESACHGPSAVSITRVSALIDVVSVTQASWATQISISVDKPRSFTLTVHGPQLTNGVMLYVASGTCVEAG